MGRRKKKKRKSVFYSEASDNHLMYCKETDDPLNHAKHVNAIVERSYKILTFYYAWCSCSASVSDQLFGLFLIF